MRVPFLGHERPRDPSHKNRLPIASLQAGVPLERVSLQDEYSRLVVQYLVAEASAGRTPNPDIMCNSRIKFGAFMDAIGNDFACVASGHYARSALVGEDGYHHDGSGFDSRIARASHFASLASHRTAQATRSDIGMLRQTRNPCKGDVHASASLPSATTATSRDYGAAASRAVLYCSQDEHKDQTYFLSQLKQSQLSKAVFPLGNLPKSSVREVADRLRLPNRARKDSQGICFLGQLDYDQFLRGHLGECPGDVREFETGELIGEHRGLWYHTIGQRRGVGPVLDPKQVSRGPWYVVRKDMATNELLVSRTYQSTDKARNNFFAEGINWIAGAPPTVGSTDVSAKTANAKLKLRVKVRHGAAWHAAQVQLLDGGSRAHVLLTERDKGLAPGQFAAFYDGSVCLGSGVISEEGLYW